MEKGKRGRVSRIRLNQEYRNKIANRMRVHLEQEDTVEKQNYDNLKADQIDIMTMRGKLLKLLFVDIIQMKMLKRHNIFKTSLKMLILLQRIVVSIFIILELKRIEIMTTILLLKKQT